MKFLSSMMLLGLTQAQLDVYRWKRFTVGTLTPLDRLLNLGDNVVDDLILEVKCDDNTNSREFWYNGITRDHIGTALCPASWPDNADTVAEAEVDVDASATANELWGPYEDGSERVVWVQGCGTQLASFPSHQSYNGEGDSYSGYGEMTYSNFGNNCDNDANNGLNSVDGVSEECQSAEYFGCTSDEYNMNDSEPCNGMSQENGSLICDDEADVEFKLYKQGNSEFNSVSETYDLRTYQFACIEDDWIEVIFLLGMRDFWEGADMCFDNSPYLDANDKYAAPDFPFVVDNNCYQTSWYDCHKQGYKLKVHVWDHQGGNALASKNWPIRLPKMYVKVAFDNIYDYFQIFPDDKAKISLYLEGKTDPQSVVISPGDYVEPICEPQRVADQIRCNNLNVYCRDATDDVVLRIVAAGEILMHTVQCDELVSDEFIYATKEQQLNTKPQDPNAAIPSTYTSYEEGLSNMYIYTVDVDQYDLPAGAVLNFEYGTYIESQEPICFTGDFFPFGSPSCTLALVTDGISEEISTRIHNANEYQIDDSVIELVINQDFEDEIDQDFNVYSTGEPISIDAQLTEAIRGAINVDYINQAVPSQLTMTGMPSCGILTKEGTSSEEQTFAMFWQYTVEEDYVIELGVGDQVDLSNESIVFSDNDSCDEFYTNFQYIVDADMPVDGPTATGILRQAEGDGAEKLSATTLGLSAIMSAKLSQLF